jgi:hypothetical protein
MPGSGRKFLSHSYQSLGLGLPQPMELRHRKFSYTGTIIADREVQNPDLTVWQLHSLALVNRGAALGNQNII